MPQPLTGADLGAQLDAQEMPLHRPIRCRPGAVLRSASGEPARGRISFSGGLTVPAVLGSRATYTHRAWWSHWSASAGDRLPLGDERAVSPWRVISIPNPRVDRGAKLRVPGPQLDKFPPEALETLQRTRFTVTSQSDRMGYRLAGGTIPRIDGHEMISDVTLAGAQIPPSGDPILLMSDRQTPVAIPSLQP